jgi:hypothetical protein
VRARAGTREFDSAADIIIFHEGRQLAVLEINRDLPLTHSDYAEAQSCANQLTPRPPLVIVTKAETRIYNANTGPFRSP